MTRKIPDDAFEAYVALGPTGRSYQTLADRYSVSKRAITKCAAREEWAERMHYISEKLQKEGR